MCSLICYVCTAQAGIRVSSIESTEPSNRERSTSVGSRAPTTGDIRLSALLRCLMKPSLAFSKKDFRYLGSYHPQAHPIRNRQQQERCIYSVGIDQGTRKKNYYFLHHWCWQHIFYGLRSHPLLPQDSTAVAYLHRGVRASRQVANSPFIHFSIKPHSVSRSILCYLDPTDMMISLFAWSMSKPCVDFDSRN